MKGQATYLVVYKVSLASARLLFSALMFRVENRKYESIYPSMAISLGIDSLLVYKARTMNVTTMTELNKLILQRDRIILLAETWKDINEPLLPWLTREAREQFINDCGKWVNRLEAAQKKIDEYNI